MPIVGLQLLKKTAYVIHWETEHKNNTINRPIPRSEWRMCDHILRSSVVSPAVDNKTICGMVKQWQRFGVMVEKVHEVYYNFHLYWIQKVNLNVY